MTSFVSSPTTDKSRDVQVAQLGADTLVLRSRSWDRLKFEVEYARQKGTTANSYLIQGQETALFDPPGESFTDLFLDELQLHQYYQRLDYIILSHVNANRLITLKRLLKLAPYATVICSKPGAIALQSILDNQPGTPLSAHADEAMELGIEYGGDRQMKLRIMRDGDKLDLGNQHELQFFFVPTPRLPDALVTYDPTTRILFTDKLFGAHICGEAVFDELWKDLQADRRYYFDCLHAAQSTQVETAVNKLTTVDAKVYAPSHGPIVRHSLSRLTLDYQQWCAEQQNQDFSVALLYASAYGNTATMAQAIAQGIQKGGAAVKSINCEFTDPAEIEQAIASCDGFVIGSPTLGGHAPVQIQTALGVVLATAAKTKVAGVFGSYGWSGEAVDMLESKLQDAGYRQGFETLRVKFKPTEEVLQECEAAGTEFVSVLKKSRKVAIPRQFAAEAQTDRTVTPNF
jgi:flavorubredoxin